MKCKSAIGVFLFWFISALLAEGQVTLPPNGDNQKSEISQYLGLVKITVMYSSPNVEGRKIWGELIPYASNPDDPKVRPWRAGANENTTMTFSHDVEIEGMPIKPGTYGIHIIPQPEKSTIIFSTMNTAWGSFLYKPSDDALRITVKPEECEFTEYLTYEFSERKQNSATVKLKWETRAIPFKIVVPDGDGVYIQNLRNELLGQKRFYWQNIISAANFCVAKNRNLEEAFEWVQTLINSNIKNFDIYTTKTNLLVAMGKTKEANEVMAVAINLPDATSTQLTNYGRKLISEDKLKEALQVFEIAYKRYPDNSVTRMGMARVNAAMGNTSKALKFAQTAITVAENDRVKTSIEGIIIKLKAGEKIN